MNTNRLQQIQELDKPKSTSTFNKSSPIKTRASPEGNFVGQYITETVTVQNNYQNSNLSTSAKVRESEDFIDPALTSLVNSLMDQVSDKNSFAKTHKVKETKLQKFSSPFLMKNSLNSSLVSTSASDEGNSCERSSSNVSWKARRSDSLAELQSVQRRDSNPTTEITKPLFRIPEQSPNAIIECMMHAAIISESQFGYKPEISQEANCHNLNVKKPVPNKYKTEICRNWEIEGRCRFGDECTFAHGDRELHKKSSMPSNYKTKICKQFTEEPYYCPYGEKCQFLHLSFSTETKGSKRQLKYSEMLSETCKQMEKKLMHMNNFEDVELPISVFKNSRLSIFKELTDNCTEDDEEIKDQQKSSEAENPAKKSTLNKKSREFFMPQRKASGVSMCANGVDKSLRSH